MPVTYLTGASGPLAKPDGILIRHVTKGFQTPGSLMVMPPKNGNPSLSTADIRSVQAYAREGFGKQ